MLGLSLIHVGKGGGGGGGQCTVQTDNDYYIHYIYIYIIYSTRLVLGQQSQLVENANTNLRIPLPKQLSM